MPGAEHYGLKPGTNITYGAGGFPDWVYQLGSQYGVEASTYAGHQEKSGENRGLDWRPQGIDINTPEGAAKMDAFASAMMNTPGVEQVIWENPFTGQRFGKDPGDRGANQSIDDYYRDNWAGHRDHVHIRTSTALSGQQDLAALAAAGNPQAQQLLASMPGGGLGTLAGGNAKQSPLEFMTDLAKNVGGSLTSIGLSFLDGITGINFSGMFGIGQQVASGLLDPNAKTSGATDLTDIAGAAMGDYQNGVAGLSPDLQALLGNAGMGTGDYTSVANSGLWQPGKKGGEAYRGLVKAVLSQYAPKYGITNIQAWEDALVKQIDSESGGDPASLNSNDSNGKGGTQTVSGLLNFLGSTYDSHNITGKPSSDPAGQIAAAIDYVAGKYGMDENGAPKQIGRGQGFAKGGFPGGGAAWLSNGEYRTNPAATQYYGPGVFNALNNMQLPRFSRGGFVGGARAARKLASGGWPLLPPPPTPAPAPTGGGQVAGPLPLDAPAPPPPPTPPAPAAPQPGLSVLAPPGTANAPSTGGAPGPGATAPAPDPGALPQVNDALTNIGGLGQAIGAGGAQGAAQPGASGKNNADPRATLGMAPESQDHNLAPLDAGIKGAFSTIGGIASSAASMAGNMFAPGAGSAAGAGIQGGFEVGGKVASGIANIFSSLMVGTATSGSTASASGTPLLPQQPAQQTGVAPIMQRVHNGDVNIANTDEWRRMEQNTTAQQVMPWIGKYG